MYFSMQDEKQVSSPRDSDAPGLGTQRSKQCSFIFSINCRALTMAASCRTWFMSWVLGSLEVEREERESMVVVVVVEED